MRFKMVTAYFLDCGQICWMITPNSVNAMEKHSGHTKLKVSNSNTKWSFGLFALNIRSNSIKYRSMLITWDKIVVIALATSDNSMCPPKSTVKQLESVSNWELKRIFALFISWNVFIFWNCTHNKSLLSKYYVSGFKYKSV